ncbi:MAG: HEPN domain-containing protein [Candidatus Aenigmatarchaeota archaeon]
MKEDTKKWLKLAEDDLKLSKISLDHDILEYSVFHAQQAAEKFLKAFLAENNVKIPKTHDLKYIISLCKSIDKSFEQLFELKAEKLTIFSTHARYPEYEFEITREMAKEAIEIAEKVKDFVLKKLNI